MSQPRSQRIVRVLKRTMTEFIRDNGPSSAAALSYYTVFALPPLLVVVIALSGFVLGESAAESRVITNVSRLMGVGVAEQLRAMVEAAGERTSGGIWATALASAGLLVAATGVFVQLQVALNRAWEIRPDPDRGGVRNFFSKRLSSFVVILFVALLVLVSLVIGAIVSGAGSEVAALLPGNVSQAALGALDIGVSLLMYTLVLGLIFKYLPDARIRWSDVMTGAAVTAVLFSLGKWSLGLYLSRGSVGDDYGAAASLALIMVWVYYSSMILLIGAEFTQAWAREFGAPVVPDAGAVRVIRQEKRIESAG